MLVTIIADASYCPIKQVAGYGYWIASDRGSDGGGGPLLKGARVENNVIAEMMAVVNALHIALSQGYVREQDIVLLQTDCVPALDAFIFKRTKLNPTESHVVKKLNELMIRYSLTLRYRHVKGHSQVKESRYITNNLCDVRAKNEMKLLRKIRNEDIL